MVNTVGIENGIVQSTRAWSPFESSRTTNNNNNNNNNNNVNTREVKTEDLGMTCYLTFVSIILFAIVFVLIIYFFYINLKLCLG